MRASFTLDYSKEYDAMFVLLYYVILFNKCFSFLLLVKKLNYVYQIEIRRRRSIIFPFLNQTG